MATILGSTRPFGAPIGPYFVKWVVTTIMILAPPVGTRSISVSKPVHTKLCLNYTSQFLKTQY